MRKGTIDLGLTAYERDILVVDSELLFSYYRRWGIKPSYKLNIYNRKIIHYIEKLNEDGLLDDIYIGVVGNYSYRKTIIENILLLPYIVKDFITEDNYGRWMEIVQPALHFAVERRKYYNKRSVVITEAFIDSGESLKKY